MEKTKRSLAQLWKRAILAQQQNGNMTAQGTCRTKKYTQHKHSGRGVPSCGMAERPRGLPQRSRKPRPSNTTKHNPTGKRRRNTNRGFRSYEKTEERKLRRRTVTAWSRTLYRCYRGSTLSGQARPGRKRQKLAHENTRRTACTEFRQATKAATAQQTHPKGTVKHKRTGKQRRGRAQNEHISNKTHQDYIRAAADLYVF